MEKSADVSRDQKKRWRFLLFLIEPESSPLTIAKVFLQLMDTLISVGVVCLSICVCLSVGFFIIYYFFFDFGFWAVIFLTF